MGKMSDNDWPRLVAGPPGQEGKDLPAILPKIPQVDKISSGSNVKVVMLEAASLNSAYHQLDQRGLQPVPVGSTYLCQDSLKLKVIQDDQELEWDLMKVAVPRPRNKVMDGTNLEKRALDGPLPSLCHRGQLDGQKTVTMAKKKGRKKMTEAKKKQLENRSIFCGPLAKKKKSKQKKSKKAEVEEEKKVEGKYVSRRKKRTNKKKPARKFSPSLDLSAEEKEGQGADHSSWRKRTNKKKLTRKVSKTLDLSAEVIR